MILLTNSLDTPVIFVFRIAFDIIDRIQMSFAAKFVLFDIPKNQTLKNVFKKLTKMVKSDLYWGLKIGWRCIFGSHSGIPVGHPAMRKNWTNDFTEATNFDTSIYKYFHTYGG